MFINVIGLCFEMMGVFLLASPAITRRKLGQWVFKVFRNSITNTAIYAVISISLLMTFALVTSNWAHRPLLLWAIGLAIAGNSFPLWVTCAYRCAREPGKPRDDDKIEKISLGGLLLLAIGFALQTLASVVK